MLNLDMLKVTEMDILSIISGISWCHLLTFQLHMN